MLELVKKKAMKRKGDENIALQFILEDTIEALKKVVLSKIMIKIREMIRLEKQQKSRMQKRVLEDCQRVNVTSNQKRGTDVFLRGPGTKSTHTALHVLS